MTRIFQFKQGKFAVQHCPDTVRHPAGFIGTLAPRVLASGKTVRSDTEFLGAQNVTGGEFAPSPIYDFNLPIMIKHGNLR